MPHANQHLIPFWGSSTHALFLLLCPDSCCYCPSILVHTFFFTFQFQLSEKGESNKQWIYSWYKWNRKGSLTYPALLSSNVNQFLSSIPMWRHHIKFASLLFILKTISNFIILVRGPMNWVFTFCGESMSSILFSELGITNSYIHFKCYSSTIYLMDLGRKMASTYII